MVWRVVDDHGLVFNLNDLDTLLDHGGDAELTQLQGKEGDRK